MNNIVTYSSACSACYAEKKVCPSDWYDTSTTTYQKSQYSCTSGGTASTTPHYVYSSFTGVGPQFYYCKLNPLYNNANDDNGFSNDGFSNDDVDDDGTSSTSDSSISSTSDSSISSGAIIGIIIVVAGIRTLLGLLSWYMKKRGYKSSIENKPLGHLISCCCGLPPCFSQGGMTACLKDFKIDLESSRDFVFSFFKAGINITALFKNFNIVSYFKGGVEEEEGEVEVKEEESGGFCSCFSGKKEEIEMPSSISKESKVSYIPSMSISPSVYYHPSPPPRGNKSDFFLDISIIKNLNKR